MMSYLFEGMLKLIAWWMMDASSSLGVLPETNFEVGSCLMEKKPCSFNGFFQFLFRKDQRLDPPMEGWMNMYFAGEPVFEA